jgi:hypothetical protein
MARSEVYDRERILHINMLMDEIYESTSDIYEQLVDKEFEPLKQTINRLVFKLKEIQNSIEDEV